MDEENKETETPTNEEKEVDTTEEETEETTTEEEETPETPSEEEIADLKKKAELAENYKIRAEKAEAKNKKTPKEKTESNDNLSPKDYLALTEAKITSEDYDEVLRVANILGKPVAEALKDKTMKSILAERNEERETAAATNTKGGQRAGTKSDGESLLQKVEKTGEVPETQEGMQKLAEARMARKKSK